MNNSDGKEALGLEVVETREWLDSLDYVLQNEGAERAGRLLQQLELHTAQNGYRMPFTATTPYIEHDSGRQAAAISGQSGNRAAHQEPGSLERAGDGGAGEQEVERHWRPYLDIRFRSHAVRSRFQSFLPRRQPKMATATWFTSRAMRRRAFMPARFSKGGLSREQLENFRRELARGRRLVVVSAPVADAGFLGISDRVDGTRADHGHLSGPVQPLPRGSRT